MSKVWSYSLDPLLKHLDNIHVIPFDHTFTVCEVVCYLIYFWGIDIRVRYSGIGLQCQANLEEAMVIETDFPLDLPENSEDDEGCLPKSSLR